MNQVYLKNVKYLISVPSIKFWPEGNRKEICIVGKSNVGKSTLINKITNNNSMAKVSSVPGHTKYLNFFDVDNKYYLVDSPGYGYAKVNYQRDEEFENMMKDYIYKRNNLICVIMIVDSKVGFNENDKLLLQMLKDANRKVLIFASKIDKTNQSERAKFLNNAKLLLDEDTYKNMLTYSALDNNSIYKLVDKILDTYSN